MSSGDEERMSPEVLNTALMYKIVKRLGNIEKILSDQIPLGKIYTIPNGVIITGDTYINLVSGIITYPDNSHKNTPSFGKGLFSISIANEGLSICTVVINPDETWGKRTLDVAETMNIDLKRPNITQLKISVATGSSCTVQISGVV